MAQLKLENLSIFYNSKEILHNVNFEIEKGDYICIVGENGSGKSTLMKTILGMHKEFSGKIIAGDDFSLNEIGYIPQQSLVQKDFPASVGEIVLSGCQNRLGWKPFYSKKEKEIARSKMEMLGIAHLEKTCFRNLSGGQQQRVLLARALCATKNMILLDEPFSALDPKVRLEMYKLVEDLNKKEGITVVMISHDTNVSLHYATKVLRTGTAEATVYA